MTTNDEPCCRICYEGPESDASDSDNIRVMVSPCGCSGSSAHIHVDCLKKLYLSRRGMCDQLHCPTCKQKYDAVNSLMLATFNLIRLRSVERAIGITRNHLLRGSATWCPHKLRSLMTETTVYADER